MSAQGVTAIRPQRAIVTPRGSPAGGGEVLPLEKYVRDLYRSHPTIAIVGPSGSGKTTAVQHLAHELADLPITFIDGEPLASFRSQGALVVAGRKVPPLLVPTLVLQLEPWGESERVDYLLAKHPKQIRSIMKRLEQCDCIDDLEGSPRLWSAILDWMARKDEALDIRHFLRVMTATVLEMFGDDEEYVRRMLANVACTGAPTYVGVPAILQHPFVAKLVMAGLLLDSIEPGKGRFDWWSEKIPPKVVRETALLIGANPIKTAALEAKLDLGPESIVSAAASVLVMIDPRLRPRRPRRDFKSMFAPGAKWPGVILPDADMSHADLVRADLSGGVLRGLLACGANAAQANFSGAQLESANFSTANCHEASFRDCKLRFANFSQAHTCAADFNGADLSRALLYGADLRGASFCRSRLAGTNFSEAKLQAVDLTGADVMNAWFIRQDLRQTVLDRVRADNASFDRANLEGMSIRELVASAARFTNSELTGLHLLNAQLRGASFRNSGLAEIDWEGADLRDADFDNASFHMGSSRSGLVGSPIACEGSRTGFYTDETSEIHKHPEEIRKANLCGADLTGAKVDKTDWYLVDLRGARYSTQQAMWFRKCGAILFDR